MYQFKRIDFDQLSEVKFNDFPSKTVLTTKDWIKFVEEDSRVTPYILEVYKDEEFCGYFSALCTKKFFFKIVGSPFPGWSTLFMGFDLLNDEIEREGILPDLVKFIKSDTKCHYIQISDRAFSFDRLEELRKSTKCYIESFETLELSIDGDDAFFFKNMKTDCRNFIRQFERRGATLEYAEPNDEFAEEFFEQLKDVFAKQNLIPTYTAEKVKCLLKHLAKNDMVLCLRVRDPEGKSIATSIFPGYNKKMFFWGGASYRAYQHYRPNEYMIYSAMRYWRDRGCAEFDMQGNRSYKKKFGSWEVNIPIVIFPKYRFLVLFKRAASSLYYFTGSLFWKLGIRRKKTL